MHAEAWPYPPWAWPSEPDPQIARGLQRQARKRAAHGQDIIGWKVGGNDLGARIRWGVQSCVFGYLTARSCGQGDQTWSLDGTKCAAVEAEIWLDIEQTLDGGESAMEIASAIGAVGLAAELIDVRGRFDDIESVLEGNIFHRAATFAAPAGLRHDELASAMLIVERNGQPVWRMPVTTFVPDLREAVAFIARGLTRSGEQLKAGQRVLSGVLTPLPVWVQPGDGVRVSAGDLGTIQLRFTDSEAQ